MDPRHESIWNFLTERTLAIRTNEWSPTKVDSHLQSLIGQILGNTGWAICYNATTSSSAQIEYQYAMQLSTEFGVPVYPTQGLLIWCQPSVILHGTILEHGLVCPHKVNNVFNQTRKKKTNKTRTGSITHNARQNGTLGHVTTLNYVRS